ncbi:hypothetical protein EJ04DRAFT_570830 [Polyplosphaeria fusca]|uniref:Heterokaryon incompatibility domain-containing protein n=1 Tax=Polyplosphaeria fusca TaxID=682080 RepID=A0A9P4QI96_9PLEO|nr:hypothetical protein EJ04DRAFT_570830 [Polyplosphaeria fusca]
MYSKDKKEQELSKPPYQAIDSTNQQIRVLEIAPGVEDAVIRCTLKRVSLLDDPPPSFETISYCWGDAEIRAIIELNGEDFSVTANCVAALKRMRYADRP